MNKVRFFLLFGAVMIMITSLNLFSRDSNPDLNQTIYQRFFSQYNKKQYQERTAFERYTRMKKMLSQKKQKKSFFNDIQTFTSSLSSSNGNQNWDDQFNMPGLDGKVLSIVGDGGHRFYVGGAFDKAGGIPVNGIAYFDGSDWNDLNGGTDGLVTVVVKYGAHIYIGGYFSQVGNIEAHNIARWDGTKWSALGSGLDSGVWSIAVKNDPTTMSGVLVYAGGEFLHAGEKQAKHLAVWDGYEWQNVGGGTNGPVMDIIATSVEGLIIAGQFDKVGNNSVSGTNHIARWVEDQWQPMGEGVDAPVVDLEFDQEILYVGGCFEYAGSVEVNHFSVWQNGSWSAMGKGLEGDVYSIALLDSKIYVGGYFEGSGSHDLKNVAMWEDEIWGDMGGGTGSLHSNAVYSMVSVDDKVYAGGDYRKIGMEQADYLAVWTHNFWLAISKKYGQGVKERIYALDSDSKHLVVGGKISRTGDKFNFGVSQWNGSEWLLMNQVLQGEVWDVAVQGDKIYAVGSFLQDLYPEGSTPVSLNHVAKWDGSQWQALGSGLGKNSMPKAIEIVGNDLYVGGFFDQAGETAVTNLARWDGTTWYDVGGGVDGMVHDLAFDGTNLYVVGDFTRAGDIKAEHIACFDGTTWHSFGNDGFDDAIYTIELIPNSSQNGMTAPFFVGGVFSRIGSLEANAIAKWSGSTWQSLGKGLFNALDKSYVYDIEWIDQMLYAGGYFSRAGTKRANNIAMWWGNGWLPLGNGLNGKVYALNRFEGRHRLVGGNQTQKLYVGGDFTMAGDKSSHALACWQIQGHTPVAVIKTRSSQPFAPMTVQFDASESIDPDGNIVSFEWNFDGDKTVDSHDCISSFTYTSPGDYNATLVVTDNDNFSSSDTITISVSAAADICLKYDSSIIPDEKGEVDFGDIYVNRSKTIEILIKNIGSDDLELRNEVPVFIDHKQFSLYQQPDAKIRVGEETAFGVTFHPTREGIHAAKVYILSNDPDETTFTFTVKGVGKNNIVAKNLAENKPVQTNDGSQDAYKMVDGDWQTYWCPAIPTADQSSSLKLFATIDLAGNLQDQTYSVQYFKYKIGLDYLPIIHSLDNASDYFQNELQIIIQTSLDDRDWQTVERQYPRFNTLEYIHLRQPVQTRYIRLLLVINRLPILPAEDLARLKYRFYEFQVYSEYPKQFIQYNIPESAEGWQMISFPGKSENMACSALFPGKDVIVMGYDGTQYQQVDTLQALKGYWVINTSIDEKRLDYSFVGDQTFSYTFLKSGWHLIGTGVSPVQLDQLYIEPANSILSYAYEYDPEILSYVSVQTLSPQKGYWMYVHEPCRVSINPATGGLYKGNINFIDSKPPTPPLLTEQNENIELPVSFTMSQNYPNPFNPVTKITYDLPIQQFVQIVVFNMKGEHIRRLRAGRQSAGTYQIEWQGRDDSGQPVPSGLYLIELKTQNYQKSIKALLLK